MQRVQNDAQVQLMSFKKEGLRWAWQQGVVAGQWKCSYHMHAAELRVVHDLLWPYNCKAASLSETHP
jgi:hypothetical protein